MSNLPFKKRTQQRDSWSHSQENMISPSQDAFDSPLSSEAHLDSSLDTTAHSADHDGQSQRSSASGSRPKIKKNVQTYIYKINGKEIGEIKKTKTTRSRHNSDSLHRHQISSEDDLYQHSGLLTDIPKCPRSELFSNISQESHIDIGALNLSSCPSSPTAVIRPIPEYYSNPYIPNFDPYHMPTTIFEGPAFSGMLNPNFSGTYQNVSLGHEISHPAMPMQVKHDDSPQQQKETKNKRKPQLCQLCKNHGFSNFVTGHKNNCSFRDCPCSDCQSHMSFRNYQNSRRLQGRREVTRERDDLDDDQ